MKDEDIRTATWRLGAALLGDNKRSLIGKWLKQTRNDAWAIHNAMTNAIKAKTEDPVPYIQAALNKSVEAKKEEKKVIYLNIMADADLPPEAHLFWSDVCKKLWKAVGPEIYGSWFNSMLLEQRLPNVVISLPSKFAMDKVAENSRMSCLKAALNGAPVELTVREAAA